MFEEEIIKEKNKITIKVSVKKVRKYSFEEKIVYRKNVESLIPLEISKGAILIKKPTKLVSNFVDKKFIQSAEWVYELPQSPHPQKKTTTKKRTTRTRARTKKTS